MADRKFNLKELWSILKATFKEWNERDPFRLSAVVAFYAILSLPALLVIIITLAGIAFGEKAVEGQIEAQTREMIGEKAAEQVQTMIKEARYSQSSIFATIVGIATLIFGATGLFFHLQKSLNEIWEVRPVPKKAFIKLIKDRAFSFGMVLVIGFLLLISLVLSAALSALSDFIMQYLPENTVYVFMVINYLLSFAIVTVLFALIFKVLPDAKIRWKDVWIGSLATAFLFELGKIGLSIYFGQSNPGSTYGAAGSIILILLWTSYASLILFLGAEFTQVYARRFGHRIEPADHAVRVSEFHEEQQKSMAAKKKKPEEDE